MAHGANRASSSIGSRMRRKDQVKATLRAQRGLPPKEPTQPPSPEHSVIVWARVSGSGPRRTPAPPVNTRPLSVPPPASRTSSNSNPQLPPPVRLGLPEFGPTQPAVVPLPAKTNGAVGQGN